MPHRVYVIELSPEVLQHKRFRDKNPNHDTAKPCVYVGMTGLSVEQRLANHRAGIKSSGFVSRYGVRLLPHLYDGLDAMTFQAAAEAEKRLAEQLRHEGYAVWQG
jgi:predicted GIY-YIG superfamily endonuclease